MMQSVRTAALALALFAFPAIAHAQDAAAAARVMDAAGVSRAKGSATATVRIYEIADFQCPFCAKFATEVYPKIDAEYVKTGKVQWVFVNMPLPMHTNAWIAAEAALCAGASDRFWQMHDRLYRSQAEWGGSADPTPMFARYARDAGVPAEPYTSCVREDRVAPLIINDVIFVAAARVSGTPTFIINDEETIVGMKTWEEWRDLIETAMKKAAAGK
jgi:protein-disulfide isomerase